MSAEGIRQEPDAVVLVAHGEFPAPQAPGLAAWWASRALWDEALPLEDREMALAAYARAIDVQLGTVGKGSRHGVLEAFPLGLDPIRDRTATAPEYEGVPLW